MSFAGIQSRIEELRLGWPFIFALNEPSDLFAARQQFLSVSWAAIEHPLIRNHWDKLFHALTVGDMAIRPSKSEFVRILGKMLMRDMMP